MGQVEELVRESNRIKNSSGWASRRLKSMHARQLQDSCWGSTEWDALPHPLGHVEVGIPRDKPRPHLAKCADFGAWGRVQEIFGWFWSHSQWMSCQSLEPRNSTTPNILRKRTKKYIIYISIYIYIKQKPHHSRIWYCTNDYNPWNLLIIVVLEEFSVCLFYFKQREQISWDKRNVKDAIKLVAAYLNDLAS